MLALALAAFIHFRDVPQTSWAYADVSILASAGVLRGERSGSFQPTADVSRQDAAATLARTLALPPATLPNARDAAEVSATLRQDVAAACGAGVLLGTAQGYLEPRSPLDRAAAAVLLARAFGIAASDASTPFADAKSIPAYARSAVAALTQDGIVQGDLQGDFRPAARVTRAEWAAMLLRAIAVAGGAKGAPSIVAGRLSTLYPPDDASLAAESPLGGAYGALGIAGRTLDISDGAFVYRGGSAADLYALGADDLVAAYVGKDGSSPILLDLAPAAKDPGTGTVADVADGVLYLSTGLQVPIGAGAALSCGAQSLTASAWPAWLLGAQVKVSSAPLRLQVLSPYAYDLSGQITATDAQGFTLRLTASSALAPLVPSLGAGNLVTVDTSDATTFAGLGADAPTAPAVGLAAQVQGRVGANGAVAADHVALSH